MKRSKAHANAEQAAADRVIQFVSQLTHSEGQFAGQPFDPRPWQIDILRRLFGTLHEDGRRQYRTCYVEIPRKNGKTTLAAAIALYMLLADGEERGQVYSAAVDRDQASLVFHAAEAMVLADPELRAAVEVVASQKRIIDLSTRSVYRAISADAPSAHGFNASAIIYDELHAAPNRALFDVLTMSTGTRRQPLTFVITTAGHDRQSICWELHDMAQKCLADPTYNPSFLPVLYSAPDESDWLDEAVWRAVNPALGDFRSLEEMRASAKMAKEIPARQNAFRQMYLCQWTESETRWLDGASWAACGEAPVDPGGLRGRRVWLGLDISATADLTACVLIAPDDDGGVTVIPQFWIPEEQIGKRMQRDGVPYDAWARDGHLALTRGNTIDEEAIVAYIQGVPEQYGVEVVELAFDPWHSG